jgi:hypothetical protein
MTTKPMLKATRYLVLTTLAAACGLVNSDITTIKFALPERTYSFDTAQAGWHLPSATLPTIPCTDANVCTTLAASAGIDSGAVICDAASGSCGVTATVETPPQTVNLKMEVPALSGMNSQSLADVTVSQIKYDITRNTLNVALPAVELFVAPAGVTSASDPQAKKFGTVPPTAAHTTLVGGSVTLDSGGQQAFVGFAHNFGTPFVFLARTVVVVAGGTPIPMGAVDIAIRAQVSVKPSF